MTRIVRRSLIVPVLATVALAIVGCSGGNTVTGSATTPPPTTASSPSGDGGVLTSLDPCSLLSQDQVNQLGLTAEGPTNTSKSRGCSWRKGTSYDLGVYIDASQGLKDLNAGDSTKVSLQSHDAIQSNGNGFSCIVDIAISNSSSVGVGVASPGNDGQECGIATQYATLIEPKLPAQQK